MKSFLVIFNVPQRSSRRSFVVWVIAMKGLNVGKSDVLQLKKQKKEPTQRLNSAWAKDYFGETPHFSLCKNLISTSSEPFGRVSFLNRVRGGGSPYLGRVIRFFRVIRFQMQVLCIPLPSWLQLNNHQGGFHNFVAFCSVSVIFPYFVAVSNHSPTLIQVVSHLKIYIVFTFRLIQQRNTITQ